MQSQQLLFVNLTMIEPLRLTVILYPMKSFLEAVQ